ncbi:hypothetical protein EVAR_97661_1 [Eumeta japonica]|uniref:Uncharacterized protein n=1 Tax=Eumeta variegata TaxID=151549 RepID=A0A4C1WWX5_EUMVA|nr:hypothetical protein EVAR_97661_1 [Eumeta japonica]
MSRRSPHLGHLAQACCSEQPRPSPRVGLRVYEPPRGGSINKAAIGYRRLRRAASRNSRRQNSAVSERRRRAAARGAAHGAVKNKDET